MLGVDHLGDNILGTNLNNKHACVIIIIILTGVLICYFFFFFYKIIDRTLVPKYNLLNYEYKTKLINCLKS